MVQRVVQRRPQAKDQILDSKDLSGQKKARLPPRVSEYGCNALSIKKFHSNDGLHAPNMHP
jgi:hypothetical protein